MKKIFKKTATILAFTLLIMATLTLVGCYNFRKKGPIPSGWYNNGGYFKGYEYYSGHGWCIEGDNVSYYMGGFNPVYQAKIVEEDGKIYFKGYKWYDLLLGRDKGDETVYEVVYDQEAKRIIESVVEET